MASPFNTFRRNQKVWLASLGIMAMIAFIFLGNMSSLTNNDERQGAASAVVETKYGAINEQELADMVHRRQVLNQFLRNLVQTTVGAFQQKGAEPRMLQFFQQQIVDRLSRMGLLNEPSETSVVDTYILSKKADALGLVMSDREINRFLQLVTMQTLTPDQIQAVIQSVNANDRVIFSLLREELLAARVQDLMVPALAGNFTPAQRWDYFCRMRRRASAEVAAVPVAPFLAEVPEPTEKEVTEFFEPRKEKYQQFGSPDFGFRLPKRVALQYLKADFEKFNDPSSVTDQDIAAHYEKHKATRYRWSGMAPDPLPAEAPAGETPPATEPPATEPEAGETPAPGAPTETPPATLEGTQPPAETAPSTETPAPTETPAEPTPTTPEGTTPDGTVAPETAALPTQPASPQAPAPVAMRAGLLRALVPSLLSTILWQVSDAAPAEQPPAAPAEQPPAAEAPPLTAPADSAPPADPAVEGQPPVEGQPAAGETPAATPLVEKPAPWLKLQDMSVDYQLPRDISAGPDPEFDPLWKVSEEIRREISMERTVEKMNAALAPLRGQMERYARRRIEAKLRDPKAKDPEMFNIAALADGHPGISAITTGLMTPTDISQDPNLGTCTPDVAVGMSLEQYLYQDNSHAYTTQFAQDAAGNRYLLWVTEIDPDHVPKLADVKADVIKAWKTEKARPLALKRAEELAAKAASASSLEAGLAGVPGVEPKLTGSFTWMTQGSIPQFTAQVPPRLSEVPNVTDAGNEFMRKVFSLSEGQTGVAFNRPEDTAYVIRALQFEPSTFDLRTSFLAAEDGSYLNAGRPEMQENLLSWVQLIKDDAQLEWQRVPRVDMR